MSRFIPALALSAFLACFALTRPVHACPNCQESISAANADDDDPLRESRAYNQSIYLMAFMPYALLGGLTIVIYRGAKAANRQAELRLSATPVSRPNEEAT